MGRCHPKVYARFRFWANDGGLAAAGNENLARVVNRREVDARRSEKPGFFEKPGFSCGYSNLNRHTASAKSATA